MYDSLKRRYTETRWGFPWNHDRINRRTALGLIFTLLTLLFIGFLVRRTNAQEPSDGEQETNPERLFPELSEEPFRILPDLEVTQRYDTNIFREEDQEADAILDITPGVSARYKEDPLLARVSHESTIKEFYDNEDVSDVDHRSSAAVKYQEKPFFLDVNGSYRHLTSPVDGLAVTNRIIRDRRAGSVTAGYHPGSTRFTVTHRRSRTNYDEPFSFLDRETPLVRVGVRHQFRDGITGLLSGEGGRRNYEDDRTKQDGEYLQGSAGLEWTPEKWFGLKVEGGYIDESFDGPSVPNADDEENQEVSGRIEAQYRPSEHDLIKVTYTHNTGWSSQSNYLIKDLASVAYRRTIREVWTVRGRLGYDLGNEGTDEVQSDRKEYYRGTFRLTREITPWWDQSLSYRYIRKDTDDGTSEFRTQVFSLSALLRF